MSDYISRQAAIDAVCMEWCNVKHQDCKHPFDEKEDDYYWCDGCETVLRTLPDLPSAQPEDYAELKREFLRMASYIDVLLECSDEQRETLIGFISRLAELMPWAERD